MVYFQESSSSLPSGLESGHAASRDFSWLETPRTSSIASSVSDDPSEGSAKNAKEIPLWRSFFTGRARSVPDTSLTSPYQRPSSSDPADNRESLTISQDKRPATQLDFSGPEKVNGVTRTSFFRPRWSSNRQASERRSSVLGAEDSPAEPASRRDSRFGKDRKDSIPADSRRRGSRKLRLGHRHLKIRC